MGFRSGVMGDESFQQFKETHVLQLQQIPTLYWESLYEKLRDEVRIITGTFPEYGGLRVYINNHLSVCTWLMSFVNVNIIYASFPV